jgi:hypothetical protein
MKCILQLLLAGGLALSLRAQPDPPVIGIQRLDATTMGLAWPAVPGAACYDLWQSRDGLAYRFLGSCGETSATLAGVAPPWGDVDLRLFRAVARDDCPTPADPPADLLAWWPLDGGGNDFTGHGWDLTPVNVTWVPGRDGQAAELNGINAYLERASASDLNPGAGGWTVSAWVQASDAPVHGAVASWYRCGANPGCNSADAALYSLAANEDCLGCSHRDASDNDAELTDFAPVQDTRWHLVTSTLSEADHRLRLYVDGSQAAVGSEVFGPLSSGGLTVPFSIGRIFRTGWASPHFYLRGRVDDVRIYGRGLSAAEVMTLYQDGGWPFSQAR